MDHKTKIKRFCQVIFGGQDMFPVALILRDNYKIGVYCLTERKKEKTKFHGCDIGHSCGSFSNSVNWQVL